MKLSKGTKYVIIFFVILLLTWVVVLHYQKQREDSLIMARLADNKIIPPNLNQTEFIAKGRPAIIKDSLYETAERIKFLKHYVEHKGGYRHFYNKGTPIRREKDIQGLFELTWFNAVPKVTREENTGSGCPDFTISIGASDCTVVEFKLASNPHLKRNLSRQVEKYKKALQTQKALTIIIFFTDKEEKKVKKIFNDLGLNDEQNIVLIDARNNKKSASLA